MMAGRLKGERGAFLKVFFGMEMLKVRSLIVPTAKLCLMQFYSVAHIIAASHVLYLYGRRWVSVHISVAQWTKAFVSTPVPLYDLLEKNDSTHYIPSKRFTLYAADTKLMMDRTDDYDHDADCIKVEEYHCEWQDIECYITDLRMYSVISSHCEEYTC